MRSRRMGPPAAAAVVAYLAELEHELGEARELLCRLLVELDQDDEQLAAAAQVIEAEAGARIEADLREVYA